MRQGNYNLGGRIAAAAIKTEVWAEARPLRALAVIVLLTLALNAAFLWYSHSRIGQGETGKWWPIALSLLHGEGYSYCDEVYFPFCGPSNRATAAREPAPVLLFAAVAALTGESLRAAASIELLINLAILPGIFFLARWLADARTAAVAALLWSVYLPPVKLLLPDVSGDLLATLGVIWGMFFFVRAQQRDCRWDWALAGACMGVAALSRSALLVLAVSLAIGLLFWPSAGPPCVSWLCRRLRPIAFFGVAFGLVLAPWVARNYIVFGHFVPGTTLADYNLYRHNFPLRTDDYLRFVPGNEGVAAVITLIEHRPDLCGCENEAEMADVYREEALRIIADHPVRYALLSAYRFAMLWFNWGINAAYSDRDTWSDYAMMLQQAFLLVTAAFGLWRTWPRSWPLAVGLMATCWIYMAVIGRMRLIIPVMPFAIILSAIMCAQLAGSIERRLTRRRKIRDGS